MKKQMAGMNVIQLFFRFKILRCIKGCHTEPHVYLKGRKSALNTILVVSFLCQDAHGCSTERLIEIKEMSTIAG